MFVTRTGTRSPSPSSRFACPSRPRVGRWGAVAALVALLTGLAAACEDNEPSREGTFPDGFLWGVSVAGFQVDMGCPTLPDSECVDPNSDWWVWTTDASLLADPSTHLSGDSPTMGPGSWELYETDFDLAASDLKVNAFRTSIEWSRIFPHSTIGIEDPNDLAAVADATALAHYRAYFTAMRDRGLSPLVTLHHYTIPVWMHDAVGCHFDLDHCSPRGWLDRETIVHEIAKYAGFVAGQLGDLVDRWATQNEPFAVVLAGYLQPGDERSNPPGVSMAYAEVKQVAAAMIEAHAQMYDAVKAADVVDADGDGVAAEVGLVFALAPSRPDDPMNDLDAQAAENVNYLYNWAFLNGVIKGELDEDLTGTGTYRADLANRMDYLGMNYYAVTIVQGTPYAVLPDLSPLTTFDPFTIQIGYDTPDGIYQALTSLRDRYPTTPIIITENGSNRVDEGSYPVQYLVEHLTWVSRAWRDGVDVRGYFYWTLMDNYEWNHGMNMKLGIYAVDPNDPTRARVPRPLADAYPRVTSANRIPDDLLELYPVPENP